MSISPLLSVKSGDEILIDANVLVYALLGSSPDCVAFIDRCLKSDLHAYTTIDVLADVCHRLMVTEAHMRGLVQRANASSLQGKPSIVRQLSEYWAHLKSLTAIAILPLDEFRFQRAYSLRLQFGLMTNDSLLLAAAEVFGIDSLATNDSDFDAIPWINIYKPSALP
jgi:predicted nucleic acid-binding protein